MRSCTCRRPWPRFRRSRCSPSSAKTLKDVQVRTRSWVEARDALRAAEDALEAERRRRRELDLQITAWERARRLAPLVEGLARLQQEVQELGDVVPFAPGARQALAAGIEQMNAAAARLQTRKEDMARAELELQAIQTDDAVLAQAPGIASLGALCGLHPNHARDLPVRQAEVDGWLAEIYRRSAEFGWGTTEEDVRARLPQDKLVRAIDALLKARGERLAEERAAKESLEERQAIVDGLQRRLDASPADALDPRLVQALELALAFKASDSRQKHLAGGAAAAATQARNALAALARPDLSETLLRSLRLPSLERVTTYRTQRQEIVQAAGLAESLAAQSRNAVAALELQRSQFERAHRVVTMAEVSEARRERDGHWQRIKAQEVPLAEGAPRLDVAMRLADELADSRTRSEADAAELQALRDQMERALAEQGQHEAAVARMRRELEEFDSRWARLAEDMGLPDMELDDMPDWLARREAFLQAADGALLRQQELATEREGAADAKRALAQAMADSDLPVLEDSGMAALCAQADDHIQAVHASRARQQDLRQQLQAAQAALQLAAKALASRSHAVADWNAKWDEVLARANLSGVRGDVAEVESAILACEFIRQRLERVDTTRTERIATMQADLQRMREAADALLHLSPALAEISPEQVFAVLSARLAEARRLADRKGQASKYLDEAKRQRDDAASELAQARRALEPIVAAAGVDDPLSAVPLVERWQASNERQLEIARIRRELDEAADGLSLGDVQAQVAAHPASQAAGEVSRLKDALGDAEARLTALVATQLQAQQGFDLIDGGDKAAVAEARRHEAVAEMSEVSEEYLQLATAASLLKWAVDRYRDRKQGPLLERASTVFRSLTGGHYQKLRVDFDQAPPALVAYRQNQPVKVAGLSDGTRDQLFLALRIAALELQSEQGAPVPFIADDLFINFDDRRSQAGLRALYELSTRTQVIFLSHQEHLLPAIRDLLPQANVITLRATQAVA
ncbi:MAG TPA: hypothetical protein VIL30_07020 [Ramlibacter sp.]|jgi:uncharacterized protein YhaN